MSQCAYDFQQNEKAVSETGDDFVRSGAGSDAGDGACGVVEGEHVARVGIPEAERAIKAAGYDPAVKEDCHATNHVGVSREDAGFSVLIEVPNPHGVVLTSGDDSPIGKGRHAGNPAFVPSENAYTGAFLTIEVPHPCGLILTAGDDPPVGEDRHAGDNVGVSIENAKFIGVDKVPHPHGVVLTSGDDPSIAEDRHVGDPTCVSCENA